MLQRLRSIPLVSLLLGLLLFSHQPVLRAQTVNQDVYPVGQVDSSPKIQPRNELSAPDTSLFELEQNPAWKDLSAAERHLLRRHKNRWSLYPPPRKQQLLNSARRFLAMPGKKRQRVRRWVRKFEQFPVRKQRRLCRRFLQQQNYLPSPCRRLLRFRLEPNPAPYRRRSPRN